MSIRIKSLFLASLGWLASPLGEASIILPREVEVRCGVLFTLQAQQTYLGWSPQFPQSFEGSDWTHSLFFGYMPFVLIENRTNTTIVLRAGSNVPATVDFSQPQLALRLKRVGASPSGYITTQPIALTQTYSQPTVMPKKFGMRLYGTIDGSTGIPSGLPVLGPGQSMMLTKWFPPNLVMNEGAEFFDYRNNQTQGIVAIPGFRGAAQAYCCDWLTGGTFNVTAGINGQLQPIPVVGTRLADAWDVELSPAPGVAAGQIQLYPATTLPTDWRNCFPEASRIGTFPFRLTDHGPAAPASAMSSSASTLMKDRVAQPIALAQVALENSVMVSSVDRTADTDQDGMDNAWETATFGIGGAAPDEDQDHDGYSNLFEFLAGTSPTDANDWIQQSLIPSSPSGHILKWTSVPGRKYRVETSQNLSDWATVTTVTGAATPAETTQYTLPVAGEKRYYRLQILSPY